RKRRLVQHEIGAGDCFATRIRIGDGPLDNADPLEPWLEVFPAPRGKVVEHRDAMPTDGSHEMFNEVRADEARPSCHDVVHGATRPGAGVGAGVRRPDALGYSTVTDLARLRGWSTFDPRFTAM